MVAVAVIGAGAYGVSALSALLETGADVTLYERKNGIGGHWMRAPSYVGIQTSSNVYRFPELSFDHTRRNRCRAMASDVVAYFEHYVERMDLQSHIELNADVQQVIEKGDHVIAVINGIAQRFDYVVYTGQATIPNIPRMYATRHNVVHTSDITDATLADLKHTKQRCVVIGGSKSSAELVVVLARHDVPVTWVARKFYTFRQVSDDYSVPALQFLKCIGRDRCIFRHRVRQKDDIEPGTRNSITMSDLNVLHRVHTVRGDVRDVNDSSVHMSGGEILPWDLIILGTGYKRPNVGAQRRVLFAGQPSDALTMLTMLNAHVVACAIAEYIVQGTPSGYVAFWRDFSSRNKLSIRAYTLHYILTTGTIPSFYVARIRYQKCLHLTILGLVVCLSLKCRRAGNGCSKTRVR